MKKKVNCLAVEGCGERPFFWVKDTFVVDEMVDVNSSIPTNDQVQIYPHMKELTYSELQGGTFVGI